MIIIRERIIKFLVIGIIFIIVSLLSAGWAYTVKYLVISGDCNTTITKEVVGSKQHIIDINSIRSSTINKAEQLRKFTNSIVNVDNMRVNIFIHVRNGKEGDFWGNRDLISIEIENSDYELTFEDKTLKSAKKFTTEEILKIKTFIFTKLMLM